MRVQSLGLDENPADNLVMVRFRSILFRSFHNREKFMHQENCGRGGEVPSHHHVNTSTLRTGKEFSQKTGTVRPLDLGHMVCPYDL